jgi:hypothetical protein
MNDNEEFLCPNCGHHISDTARSITTHDDAAERQVSSVMARAHARAFATDTLEDDELGRVSSEEMYAAYLTWATDNSRQAIGPKALGMALRAISYEPYRTKSQRGYSGVRVKV